MQQEKSHIQQVINTVFTEINGNEAFRRTGEKKKLEEALATEKEALETKQRSTTTQESGFLGVFKKKFANATQETPYPITLLTALIKHLNDVLEEADKSNFFNATWYLLEYLQHQIENPDQGSPVAQANQRRTQLSQTLSQTYHSQANQARETHENDHEDKTSRLAKFKEKLNPQEKEEERKVLSWGPKTLGAQRGSTEQQTLIDSYHTLKTIHEAKGRFYQAAELKKSGIDLQKQYLQTLGMNKPQGQFLEEKDTEKMEHRVDALAELTPEQKQASFKKNPFTFHELIRGTSQQAPLLPNLDDRPQPTEQDKAHAKAALQNYLVIKALGSLQATDFQDTATLQSIALFLMQTTLLAQNTALPTPFTTLRNRLKQEADTVLATAEAEAKQASPELTARQTALKLQLAQMAVTHYSGAEANQASTPFQIQSERKEEYFTHKIKPAMEKVNSLNENELDFWLAYFPNGDRPNSYEIQAPDNSGNNALFYDLAPKKYTENEVRAREEKAREAASQRVTVLQTQRNQIQDELTAQKELNRQLPSLQQQLTQALAEEKKAQAQAQAAQAQAEAKTAQGLQTQLIQVQEEAKTAQDALRTQQTQAQAGAKIAQDLNAQLTQARDALQTQLTQARDALQTQLREAQAPLKLPHFLAELVGAMGATIAYLVLSPEKGKMPPLPQLGIIVASFIALTVINVVLYRCRASKHEVQVTPGAGVA